MHVALPPPWGGGRAYVTCAYWHAWEIDGYAQPARIHAWHAWRARRSGRAIYLLAWGTDIAWHAMGDRAGLFIHTGMYVMMIWR